MGKIIKVSEHIDQACRVYGEKWREILFKKWTFFNNINPDDSYVYLIIMVEPSIWESRIYDTEEEATKELLKVQNEWLKKIMERTDWTRPQIGTHWVRGLENDLQISASSQGCISSTPTESDIA